MRNIKDVVFQPVTDQWVPDRICDAPRLNIARFQRLAGKNRSQQERLDLERHVTHRKRVLGVPRLTLELRLILNDAEQPQAPLKLRLGGDSASRAGILETRGLNLIRVLDLDDQFHSAARIPRTATTHSLGIPIAASWSAITAATRGCATGRTTRTAGISHFIFLSYDFDTTREKPLVIGYAQIGGELVRIADGRPHRQIDQLICG